MTDRYLLKAEACMAGVQARVQLCVCVQEVPFEQLHAEQARACSEMIPFKLDLDNSSERTSCFLAPPLPRAFWRTDFGS